MSKFHSADEEVHALMTAEQPGRVYLPNLHSAVEQADFVQEEISALVKSNRLVEWHYPEGRVPQVILPLG